MARKEFNLPQELSDRLKDQALREYTKESEVIRRALVLYFNQMEAK